VWSLKMLATRPCESTPGPTRPSHVFVMSSWKSPWFQAKSGFSEKQLAAFNIGVQPCPTFPDALRK
jgi:hypothetical protein